MVVNRGLRRDDYNALRELQMRPMLTIRRAEPRDARALGTFGAALMRTHAAFDPQRFLAAGDHAERGYAGFLRSQLDDEDVAVLVAERDQRLVGYVYAGLEPMSWKELRGPAGFIHDVVVDDDERGAGTGTALIESAVAWLKERGAPRVVLWTADRNADAQRLFARLGFRRTTVEMTREL
jgi:GNAT superfamily N-acetyltransferase